MLRGPFSRGSSALAALVLVAIFGFIALAVSGLLGEGKMAFSGESSAQLAQSGAATTPKADEAAVSLGGATRCKSPVQMASASEMAALGDGEAVVNRCVPGCSYKVQENDGTTKVDATDTCDATRAVHLRTNTAQTKAALEKCERTAVCRVEVCPEGEPCQVLGGSDRNAKLNDLLPRSGEPAQLRYTRDVQAALDAARKGEDITPFISKASPEMLSAFGLAQNDAAAQLQSEIDTNEQKQKEYQDEFERLVKGGAGPDETQTLLDNKKNLEERNAYLSQQKENLSEVNLEALRANASVAGPSGEPEGGAINPSATACKSATCVDAEIARQNTFLTGCKSESCVRGEIERRAAEAQGRQPSADPRGVVQEQGGGGFGAGLSKIGESLLGSLTKALGGGAGGSGQACSSDPNAYAQQQQQYNLQLQQYNLQLQQYNQQQYYGTSFGYGAPTPPVPPQPCTPSNQSQCRSQPQQPPASSCTTGTWRPIQNGACVTSWQCVPSGTAGDPTAQLSCQPKVADVGMAIAISYACGNSTGSSATGFTTNSALSGSAQATTTQPSAGTNTNVFTLTCANQARTASAQCTVQIAKPSIVLVANPKEVVNGEASTIGWITSGMQSCIVSSPDQSDFTARNAANTSVNGMATTSPITAATRILLNCQTFGGDTREASTTVSVVTP